MGICDWACILIDLDLRRDVAIEEALRMGRLMEMVNGMRDPAAEAVQ
jgi:hypothetical protein